MSREIRKYCVMLRTWYHILLRIYLAHSSTRTCTALKFASRYRLDVLPWTLQNRIIHMYVLIHCCTHLWWCELCCSVRVLLQRALKVMSTAVGGGSGTYDISSVSCLVRVDGCAFLPVLCLPLRRLLLLYRKTLCPWRGGALLQR